MIYLENTGEAPLEYGLHRIELRELSLQILRLIEALLSEWLLTGLL